MRELRGRASVPLKARLMSRIDPGLMRVTYIVLYKILYRYKIPTA